MTARLYLNGQLASAAASLTVPSVPAIIGDSSAGARRFSGMADEIRISDSVRGQDYITNTYNNIFRRDLFVGTGNEEVRT